MDKIEEIELEEDKITNFNFKMQVKFCNKNYFEDFFVKFKGHDMLLFSKMHVRIFL